MEERVIRESVRRAVWVSARNDGGGGKYQVTATPIEYGKTGKLSFYTDETKVVRSGDHGGGPASAQDKPVTRGQ